MTVDAQKHPKLCRRHLCLSCMIGQMLLIILYCNLFVFLPIYCYFLVCQQNFGCVTYALQLVHYSSLYDMLYLRFYVHLLQCHRQRKIGHPNKIMLYTFYKK
jgi:hypothetical protein